MSEAHGRFEVQSTPLESDPVSKELGIMRMKFEKTFAGSLVATSVVSMMGLLNKDLGSGAYVALEKVTGELDSKKGSFCLAHSSSMNKGVPKQSIAVVPDSGTGDLVGISGEMTIDIREGQHFYIFTYQL